jgi:hypothetical protein
MVQPARVLMPAQDGRRARELLYFAAVLGDSHHLIRSDLLVHLQPVVTADLIKVSLFGHIQAISGAVPNMNFFDFRSGPQ